MDNQTKYEDPFKVPEGYFEVLYAEILNRKTTIRKRHVFGIGNYLWTYRTPSVVFTTCAIFVAVVIYQFPTDSATMDCVSLTCIDDVQLFNAAVEVDDATLIDYVSAEFSDSTFTDVTLDDVDEELLLNEL